MDLSGVQILRGLDIVALAEIDQLASPARFSRNQVVIDQDADDQDVYFILKGKARALVYSLGGKQVTFRDIYEGEMFGEFSAFDDKPRSACVIAVSDLNVARLPAADFRDLTFKYRPVGEAVIQNLVGLLRRYSTRVAEFSTLSVATRLHAELLRLGQGRARASQLVDRPDQIRIEDFPKHEVLASLIATHREAVSRELSRLAREGVVARDRGTLIIRDLNRLLALIAAAET
jgi:CRP/FNR family cyclic AMP-dependent transcriptional regulator